LVYTLRSANQKTLRSMIALYNRIFPIGENWEGLQQMSIIEWLVQYRESYLRPKSETRGIGLPHLRVHLRHIERLYNTLLHPEEAPIHIPVPAEHEFRIEQISDTEDIPCNTEGMRRLVSALRAEFCAKRRPPHVQGFLSEEIYRLLSAASTNQERLILLLFVTTGLRIGGMAALRIPGGMPKSGKTCVAHEIPRELVTTEKFNQTLTVALSNCCRILVARWIRYNRVVPAGDTDGEAYLFPSLCKVGTHISTVHIWRICRSLFQQANVPGHPHCFRHTTVRMLFMTGLSLEVISKFLGHKDASVTSATYCRLDGHELQSLICDVPFSDTTTASVKDERQKWYDLATFLRNPFPLPKEDWDHVQPTVCSAVDAKVAQLESLRAEITRQLAELK
jgi:integrase